MINPQTHLCFHTSSFCYCVQHVHRPWGDAAHLCQPRDEFIVS